MMSSSMITIGPHTFTRTDALRTVGKIGILWDLQMDGRCSPAAQALGDALAVRLAVLVGEPKQVDATDLHDLGVRAARLLAESPELVPVLEDVWSTLPAAAAAARADGQMPATATGSIVQVSASEGGVPKLALAAADVGFRGLQGDTQRVRVHHGRPWQALCIYADEVIEMLQQEGHPIARGSVGENITVRGLPWEHVRPGVLLRMGTVVAHVQAYAEPCATNKAFFIGGEFQRMHADRGPVSRVYATVLTPGRVAPGDPVILEP
jgi:MOSC domain-containing protein YiiM